MIENDFDNSKEIHIHAAVDEDAEFPCPICGNKTRRSGYESTDRIWRHTDWLPAKTLVHCHRPKVNCPVHGIQQIEAPFARKYSRFTFQFEAVAVFLLREMPCRKASVLLRCDERALSSIAKYWVDDALAKDDLSAVNTLAIDETSHKRGHKYVTVIIDPAESRVIDVEEGKDSATIDKFAVKLVEKGGDPEKIAAVSSDMSAAFLSGIDRNFPNADSVIDKFHVKQTLLSALDMVRKEEQLSSGKKKPLFQGRRLFWVPESKQTEGQTSKIASLSKMYPKTGRAYRIVCALDKFYAQTNEEDATNAFKALVSWMKRCRLKPIVEAAQTFVEHKVGILAYFKNRVTNAVCEGINSVIQAAKRKARGFKTFEGFKVIIYLVAGKLELDLPGLY
jgi:transposase